MKTLASIERAVCRCKLCPRLVEWREQVAKERVRRFASEKYWGKAVPSFGDHTARLLIVGLAPAAHGANRTGRMFTGDRSGDWLYRALYQTGFASQAASVKKNDGLTLKDCYITASVRCAPPANKPEKSEKENCQRYLEAELAAMKDLIVFVVLGGIAFTELKKTLKTLGITTPTGSKFGHGEKFELSNGQKLICSYHPSQQNTFTGRLTEEMLRSVFERAKELIEAS